MHKERATPSISLIFTLLLAIGAMLPSVGALAADTVGGRSVAPLDSNWRFIRKDVPDAYTPGFDDLDWAEVTLPHTYNGSDGEDGGGYYRGAAWYRRTLAITTPLVERSAFLQFDGAALAANVYVNGQLAGKHEGGYAGFRIDVTDLLKPGPNRIAVRVDNSRAAHIAPLGGDFTIFGGLFRRAFLITTSSLHIDALDYGGPGVYVSTTGIERNGNARLALTIRLRNNSKQAANAFVSSTVLDAEGVAVERIRSRVNVAAGAVASVMQQGTIKKARLWNGVRDPYLYRVVTEVVDGELAEGSSPLDTVTVPLGVRTVQIDPKRGFVLNGEPVPIHGVNLFHSGRPGRGLAVSDAEVREDLLTLKSLGVTGVRFVHFQHPQAAYEEADRLGFIVWTEIPLNGAIDLGAQFERNATQQMRELIRQNFNHPSVAVWGLGNEVYESNPNVTRVLRTVQRAAKQEDPTRVTAYAHCCQADDDEKALQADVSAFNRYFGWYPEQKGSLGEWARDFHQKFPDRAFAVSEYGAGANILHQQDPPVQPDPKGDWHPEQYQSVLHETSWRQLANLDYLWGKFVWVAFDLASDGRSEGDRPGLNDKGLITYDRAVRKDAFYWYQANWTTEPMLHLTSKRASPRTVSTAEIKVYSNLQMVTLKLNGELMGTAPVIDRIARWKDVTLKPGVNRIEVEAQVGGTVLRDMAMWTYRPAR